jgi:hypothetical protein
MAKQSGLGDNFYVHGIDLSGDTASLGRIGGGPAALDVTGINKSANERIGGVRDGSIEWQSFFNPAVGASHPTLSALPTTDIICSYFRGTVIGGQAASIVAKQLNYDANREQEGALNFAVESQGNGYGLEWGRSLTAGIRQDTAAANGAGVDFGASTSFGLQLYVHLFDFTGTSVTVKVQESSDDAAADAYADVTGATSGALTAVGAVRAQTARNLTVERYLRVVTTGTFTVADIAVMVVKNVTSVVF